MKYLRTFIAVPVKLGNHFTAARAELMEGLSQERISWVNPERYHITIRFLGDTPPDLLESIRVSMRTNIELPQKTLLQVGNAGSFGPMKKPRVIWLGFKDSTVFDMLREDVDQALAACGIPGTDQAFRAHLTLGRIRGLKDRNEYYRLMDSMKSRFSGEILINQLVLYKSELESQGPVYTPLEELLFKDQPL